MKLNGDLTARAKDCLKDSVIEARPLALENIAVSTMETKGATIAPDIIPHKASLSMFGLIIMFLFFYYQLGIGPRELRVVGKVALVVKRANCIIVDSFFEFTMA